MQKARIVGGFVIGVQVGRMYVIDPVKVLTFVCSRRNPKSEGGIKHKDVFAGRASDQPCCHLHSHSRFHHVEAPMNPFPPVVDCR
jgi:hypothetical protein